jgi:DNA-binding MarR family transcriptional regulator
VGEQASAVEAWEALFRAQVAVLRDLQREFPTEALSLNEYDVLFNLSRQPEHRARIRELNKQLLLTQPSVSRLLDRLASRGLITKASDPDDRRGTIVRLTDAGFDLYRRVAQQHAQAIHARVGGTLDAQELTLLAEISDKLRRGAP